MKYDIEVPTTFLKEEVLERQRRINGDEGIGTGEESHVFSRNQSNGSFDNLSSYANSQGMTSPSTTTTTASRPVLRRSEGSANLLEQPLPFDILDGEGENIQGNEIDHDNSIDDKGGEGDHNEGEEEINYFNPTKQNIIKKVIDFSVENKKDKDRLKALFSNKTFLTETKSLPVSMFISKPDIDDIDIDLDDDPELLQLKLEQENFKNDNISKKVFEREMEELAIQQQQRGDDMNGGDGDGHDPTDGKDGSSSHKKSGKKGSSKNGFKGDFIKRNIQV